MAVRRNRRSSPGRRESPGRPDGSLYLADTESHTIRRIDLKSGVITTVIGTGQRGDGPDGPARECRLARPHGIFVSAQGKVYVSDSESHRVRALL